MHENPTNLILITVNTPSLVIIIIKPRAKLSGWSLILEGGGDGVVGSNS